MMDSLAKRYQISPHDFVKLSPSLAAWDLASISVGTKFESLMNETDDKGKSRYDSDSAFIKLTREYDLEQDVIIVPQVRAETMTPAELSRVGTRGNGRYVVPFQVG